MLTASCRPSGESATVAKSPTQPGSISSSTPSRVTHTTSSGSVAWAPVPYSSVPSFATEMSIDPKARMPRSCTSAVGSPVSSMRPWSKGAASNAPSLVTYKRCPEGAYLAATPRTSTLCSPVPISVTATSASTKFAPRNTENSSPFPFGSASGHTWSVSL